MSSTVPRGTSGRKHNRTQAPDGALPGGRSSAPEKTAIAPGRASSPAQTMWSKPPNTIRVVTPDASEEDEEEDSLPGVKTEVVGVPLQTSPRVLEEKPKDRRRGLVFQDSYITESAKGNRPKEGGSSKPPVSLQTRPRTHTIHEPPRHQAISSSSSKGRSRISSVHSIMSPSSKDVGHQPEINSSSIPLIATPPPLQKSNSTKGSRRLIRKSSQPASPLATTIDIPSIDSLLTPVATDNVNKVLSLMKTLCGRMRGDVEHQMIGQETWLSSTCYIDEAEGALKYSGDDREASYQTLLPNLRGCRVRPVDLKEKSNRCLQISDRQVELLICPLLEEEFDFWLAALLSWQEVRTSPVPPSPLKPVHGSDPSSGASGSPNIIKVAKLLLWDKGPAPSPSAAIRRPSTRDTLSPSRSSWRQVSCTLQDNGEFRLLTENDVTLLSVIQLCQLSRSAVQLLDKSVLGEKFCIAIFPQYAPTATRLSIFRPVYLALESRIIFEVWFSLLRAFSVPEIHGPCLSKDHEFAEDPQSPSTDGMFRIEKSLTLRVVEARLRRTHVATEPTGKHLVKPEPTVAVGDYFVETILDGEIRARTITKAHTQTPFWREDYEFPHLPTSLPRLTLTLKRTIPSEGSVHKFTSTTSVNVSDSSSEISCGSVDIPLSKLAKGEDHESWYPIFDDKQESVGEMFLKFRVDEIAVLLAREYQDISELLHRFNTGLTVRISQAMPTNLRKLSEILTNIFQVSGQAGEWLISLVEEEIDGITKEIPVNRIRWSRRISSNESAVSERELSVRDMGKSLQGEANLLFRGNSLLTQALDFHMRRLGGEYLEEVLSTKILEINTLNAYCEVDPSRLAPGEDINKNWARLMSLTTDIWESIAESVSECPPEMRQVLKYIRAVAEDRYGDFLRTTSYTSVSGFLFLRFFCPALLNPKLFGLLPDSPLPKAQRTLTLIAKSLQALANLSTFGQKEEWMVPMNKFLISHRQAVKGFIDALCSIPSMGSHTFGLSASYSTPIMVLSRLSSTAKEGFPSLPYLIDHARNFAALVKLWLDATGEQPPPPGTEDDLLEFNRLCIDLQRRTDEYLCQAEENRNTGQSSPELENTIEDTAVEDAVSPTLAAFRATQNEPSSSATASTTGSARSAGSDVDSRQDKEKQTLRLQVPGKVTKSQKQQDVADTPQSPPTGKGQLWSGKQSRNFLGGLTKRKGKGDTLGLLTKDKGSSPKPSGNGA